MEKKKGNPNNQKSPANYETGHAKNIANFQAIIETVKTMPKYNPNSERFTITGLEASYQQCHTGHKALVQTEITLASRSTQRQNLFAPLKSMSTRIVNALADTEASNGFKKDAAALARKLSGRRAKPIKDGAATNGAEMETPQTRSVSQLSFDNQVEHFNELVALIATEPTYKNTDEELSLVALQARAKKMDDTNKSVKEAAALFGNQLRTRNKLLYQEKYGMNDTAKEVKKLVRSAYGTRSPEGHAVATIQFTSPKK